MKDTLPHQEVVAVVDSGPECIAGPVMDGGLIELSFVSMPNGIRLH